MLDITMENGVIHVKESILGFLDTKVSHFYYDLERKLQSGGSGLNAPCDRAMPQRTIDWVTEHYLPKALAPAAVTPEDPGKLTSAQHISISNNVTASMQEDDYFTGHTREQCAAERRSRYEALESELSKHALEGRRVMAPKVLRSRRCDNEGTAPSI